MTEDAKSTVSCMLSGPDTFFDAFKRGKRSTIYWEDQARTSPFCYPGLRSFNPAEGLLFFGRDASLREVQLRLGEQRTLVVLGGSGSGKSSLIRAGILPFLNSTRPPFRFVDGIEEIDRSGIWFWTECRPRTKPFAELKEALKRVIETQVERTELSEVAQMLKTEALHLVREFDSSNERDHLELADRRQKRAEHLSDNLYRFAEILDEIDEALHGGFRAGPTNLMLLIDQFEELFRPEIEIAARDEFLDFLVVTHARIEKKALANPAAGPGLFMVLTMRSEELHRCAEHPPLAEQTIYDASRSLTDLVNKSFYLLRLLDPEKDKRDLRDAILEPAQTVARAYEIAPETEIVDDYPFAPGVIDWLLRGADAIGKGDGHQPDQMPLLQHALAQMWCNAGKERATPHARLEIAKEHLFHHSNANARAKARKSVSADLRSCLIQVADHATEQAESKIRAHITTNALAIELTRNESVSEFSNAVMASIFRGLVRRDDRNNWTRRISNVNYMALFLNAERGTQSTDGISAIEIASRELLGRELIQQSPSKTELDICHEALVRNWPKCQKWLEPLEIVGKALKRVVEEKDLAKRENQIALDSVEIDCLTEQRRNSLPQEWAKEEVIAPLLESDDLRVRWSEDTQIGVGCNDEPTQVLKWILERRVDQDRQRAYKLKRRFAVRTAIGVSLAVVTIFASAFYVRYQRDQAIADNNKKERNDAIRSINAALLLEHSYRLDPEPGRAPSFSRLAIELLFDHEKLEGLSGEKPESIDAKKDEVAPLAYRSWDFAVRRIVGGYLLKKDDLKKDERGLIEKADKMIARCLKAETTDPLTFENSRVELKIETTPHLRAVLKGFPEAKVAYEVPLQIGDQICLSEDATQIAWVTSRESQSVSFAEIDWVANRDGNPEPYLNKPTSNKASGTDPSVRPDEEPRKTICINGFFKAKGTTEEYKGITYRDVASIPPSACPEEAPSKNYYINISKLNWFSPFDDTFPLTNETQCEQNRSMGEGWACPKELTVKLSMDPSQKLMVATLKRNNDENTPMPIPIIRELSNVRRVHYYNGDVIVELNNRLVTAPEKPLRFAIKAPGGPISETLKSIAPNISDLLTENCRERLKGCKDWVRDESKRRAEAEKNTQPR